MYLSILIPTFDGRIYPYLDLTLQSIKKQNILSVEYEIIVLNDGTLGNGSEVLAKKYGCKYIFTGQRNINNKNKIYWRTAAFSFNIGIKKSLGDIILCQEPEVYILDVNQVEKMIQLHIKEDKIAVHPKKVYIDTGVLLDIIKNGNLPSRQLLDQIQNSYHEYFWYSLMLKKKDLLATNGWEETMHGECYDDGLFYDVLKNYGIKFIPLDSECVHMFHVRQNTPHHEYNKKRYEELRNNCKNNLTVPNWGNNEWVNFWNI